MSLANGTVLYVVKEASNSTALALYRDKPVLRKSCTFSWQRSKQGVFCIIIFASINRLMCIVTSVDVLAVAHCRIALLSPHGNYFCRGSDHPRGLLAMKMRHLRLLGYEVILVSENKMELWCYNIL